MQAPVPAVRVRTARTYWRIVPVIALYSDDTPEATCVNVQMSANEALSA
jgi:hypothetical protein